MTNYAGLDVSDKLTHICVVDRAGLVLQREALSSDPEAIAQWLKRKCPGLDCGCWSKIAKVENQAEFFQLAPNRPI